MNQEEFFKRYTYSPSRDRIGGGGFGTVYKAYDEVLHREVAIKVSEVKTTADGKKTFSLKDEFEALDHVPKHPNIANYEEFYSFEMPNGIFDYAVMQYYPDGNLSNAIKQNLTEEQKEDVAIQLLEGIDFLHKHKVVHRDLKPGNILIVKHGGRIIPLITDFGLSKAAGVVDGSVFSNSFAAGTPRYSSPEQLQGRPLRLNTDLWSYGAILYELFTGEQLFSAGSSAANTAQADHEIYSKIVNGDVQSLAKMPEKWRKVAERCLVVDAGKRAKDAMELMRIIKGDDDETEPIPLTGVGGFKNGKLPNQNPPSGNDPLPASPNDPNVTSKGSTWIVLGVMAVLVLLLFLLFNLNGTNQVNEGVLEEIIVDSVLKEADSTAETQVSLEQTDVQKKEDEAYARCTTIKGCDIYLKAYPKGRYVEEVKATKAELEAQADEEALKKEDAAYKKCTTIDACEAYLKAYPNGRYVDEVKAKLQKLKQKQESTIEESVEVLQPLPAPKGKPDLIYYFRRTSSFELKSARSQDALLIEALNTYNITGFKIYGWAVPDEDAEESPITMSENYVKSIESQIKKFIRQSGKNVNNYSFETKGYGWDWNKLVELIRDSEIPDRDNIANSLNNSSNKEETLTLYPQLEKDVLPSMRRVEVFFY